MKNTVLSARKKLIILLSALTIILAAAAVIIGIVFKPPVNTVLKYDSDGDEVYAYISIPDGTSKNVLESYLKTGQKSEYDVMYGTGDVYFTFRARDAKITYRPFILPEIPLEKLYSIEISNSTGNFTLVCNQDGTYYLSDAPKIRIDSGSASTLALQARYMLALEKVVNPSSDLSTYGLSDADNPAKITITDTDGNKNTVLFGNSNLSGGGFYMKHADKPYIYVMDTSASVFELPATSLVSPVLEKKLEESEYSYMESFSISKKGEKFIECVINTDTSDGSPNLHKIIYPANCSPSLTNYYTALTSVASISGTSVVEYGVSAKANKDEIFEAYGLSSPSNQVNYSVGDKKCSFITGSTVTLPDGEQCFYAYSAYNDCIVTLPVKSVEFLNYELIDFINLNVFQYNIENVDSILVETPDGQSNFVLSGSKSELSVKETNSGKSIDTDSFRQMYISLLSVAVDDYHERTDTAELTKDLSFTVKTKFGKSTTYSFYTLSTLRCLTTVNPGDEFYVANRAYVDKILENTNKLLNNIDITPDY